ncbi:MAG: CPBP family intramembrane glutamic endopeptidase [Acidobacteriota bacterium]|nr:CPBP family intramembrane metalloprotease [Blastocatellia bacterium]MDW8412533.1 CPBP family intramembrane glutamic endopeptidase [Acidobacteriota bacterium]
MVALAVIPGWISGGFTFSMNETFSPLQILSCWIFLLIAASLEELLFRGYPLQELAASLGRLPSALIMSVPFALVHTDNPCHTLFANINTLLAGLWLCAAYFKTNNLWLATGLHLGWNFALASVFGINVSGIDAFSQSSFLAAKYNGQQLLTGGCYGIEASLPATVILGLSAATLAFPKRRPDANNSDGRANTSS